MDKKIIVVSHLCKRYKDIKAVDDLSFEVREGELFAFLGLNGAGKSTTVNMLSGILGKDSGSILVDGYNIDFDEKAIKYRIGVVFQDSVLDKKLTVYDNLMLKAALYDVTGSSFKKKLAELSELLDLGKLLKRTLGKLSGGQRRRIDIARALLNDPKILFLDEPTTGLDPQTRLMVWDCLNKLRRERSLTIFLTTHYMEEAAEADYVVILDAGRIAAEGTPVDLKNAYASDYIKIYGHPDALPTMIEKEKLAVVQHKEYVRLAVPDMIEARRLILAYPGAFVDFEVEKGTMDDVFLKVTGKSLAEDRNHE